MNSVFAVLEDSTKLIGERLATWTEAFIVNIPNLLVALVIITLFMFLANFIQGFAQRRARQFHFQNSTMTSLFATGLKVVVILVGVFLALSVVKLDKAVLSMLAGLGILGLALGFAFQDIAANFMSGLLLAIRSPFRVGDVIEVSGISGTVSALNLRDTEIKTFQGQRVYIPNKNVIGGNLINFSAHRPRKLELIFGIDYSASIEDAQKILESVAGKDSEVLSAPKPSCVCVELAESSITLNLRVWINYPGTDPVLAKDRLFKAGKSALDQAEIGIPFAIRTIEIANINEIIQLVKDSRPHSPQLEQSDTLDRAQTQ